MPLRRGVSKRAYYAVNQAALARRNLARRRIAAIVAARNRRYYARVSAARQGLRRRFNALPRHLRSKIRSYM